MYLRVKDDALFLGRCIDGKNSPLLSQTYQRCDSRFFQRNRIDLRCICDTIGGDADIFDCPGVGNFLRDIIEFQISSGISVQLTRV